MVKLSKLEIRNALEKLTPWEVINGQLTRSFKLPSFSHAVLFLAAAGQLAEAAGHHPDLILHGYNNLTVKLSTHSVSGLTEKDFQLARQIEDLPQKRSV